MAGSTERPSGVEGENTTTDTSRADGPGRSDDDQPVETGTVRTNGIDTYYERRGDGPPVVFVHGAVMNARQWDPQMAALDDEYTTVAYDVRGHGRTGGSDRKRYDADLYAEDLDALLSALDIDRAVLVGLSMGGIVAQTYAARHPERVAGLVLADTFSTDMSSPTERLQLGVLRAFVLPVRLVGYERVQRFNAWVHERFNRGASGDYERVEEVQAAAPTMATTEFAKVIRSLGDFRRTDVDYASITVPTTVLYGENEPGFIVRQCATLAARISDTTLKAVPGAGHASNLDDPEFFTAAVREVLEQAFGDD